MFECITSKLKCSTPAVDRDPHLRYSVDYFGAVSGMIRRCYRCMRIFETSLTWYLGRSAREQGFSSELFRVRQRYSSAVFYGDETPLCLQKAANRPEFPIVYLPNLYFHALKRASNPYFGVLRKTTELR